MKCKSLVFWLFIILFALVQPVSAHIQGVSIFKINNINTKAYNRKTDPPRLNLPSDADLAPQIYKSNERMSFELDVSKFPTPLSIFKKTNFIWDFEDGSQKQTLLYGINNNHIYMQEGEYILTIYADYKPAGFESIEPQLLETVLIKISDENAGQKIGAVATQTDLGETSYSNNTDKSINSKPNNKALINIATGIIAIGIVGLLLAKKHI